MFSVLLRGFIYLLAAIFLGELVQSELLLDSDRKPFTESGYVQLIQSFFLLIVIVLLFLNVYRADQYQHLSVCMGLFFVGLLIRENDQPLELFLPHGSWKFIVVIPLVVFIAYFWKYRKQVTDQLIAYSNTASFGILLSGFVTLVFSRLFGRNIFWHELMGDNYLRAVKNAAEESVELLGLGLILIAIVEFFYARKPTN